MYLKGNTATRCMYSRMYVCACVLFLCPYICVCVCTCSVIRYRITLIWFFTLFSLVVSYEGSLKVFRLALRTTDKNLTRFRPLFLSFSLSLSLFLICLLFVFFFLFFYLQWPLRASLRSIYGKTIKSFKRKWNPVILSRFTDANLAQSYVVASSYLFPSFVYPFFFFFIIFFVLFFSIPFYSLRPLSSSHARSFPRL